MSLELPKGITKAEQETVIRWDEDEHVVTIWSASPVVLRRLHKLGLVPASESRRRNTGALHGREYKLPLADFRWGLRRKGHHKGRFFPKAADQEASLSTQQPAEGQG